MLTTLLYQTGYLTIKSYADRQFVLGFPNQEVAESCSLALAQFINPIFDIKQRIITDCKIL